MTVWEWDLQFTEEDEEPRPEFETSVKTFRINPVTKEKEPYLPTWNRALRFLATGVTVLFMVWFIYFKKKIVYKFLTDSCSYGCGLGDHNLQNKSSVCNL